MRGRRVMRGGIQKNSPLRTWREGAVGAITEAFIAVSAEKWRTACSVLRDHVYPNDLRG